MFSSITGYIFPALVAALVPIRSFLVPRYFSSEDLKYLDPIGETEEEAHDERAKYLERRPSVDEVEHQLPTFSDFHAEGIKRDFHAKIRSGSHDAFEIDSEGGSSSLVRRHRAAD